MITSGTKWIEDEEKPTKYILKLESPTFLNKSFTELEINDGTVIPASRYLAKRNCFTNNYTPQD